MSIKFDQKYRITGTIAQNLMHIEAARQTILLLPLTPAVLRSLRETARLHTTHYSKKIEGNALSLQEIKHVVHEDRHVPGRQRDEYEVKGYYAALHQVEQWGGAQTIITQDMIQRLHGLVMSHRKNEQALTPYRDGQNVIRDGVTREIVYMPPEAHDVPLLMAQLVALIDQQKHIPCPIIAAIVHYQFATIHPYYDGNGRTARLLTTLILHIGGYDLKGLYSLEEYYAENLDAYYDAIAVGPSHNYYMGRAQADITDWIEYFIAVMASSFHNVAQRMQKEEGLKDHADILKKLDPKQRKVLDLFMDSHVITSRQVSDLFGIKQRTSSHMCLDWVTNGFLEIVDPSNKARTYRLAKKYEHL